MSGKIHPEILTNSQLQELAELDENRSLEELEWLLINSNLTPEREAAVMDIYIKLLLAEFDASPEEIDPETSQRISNQIMKRIKGRKQK